MTQIRDTAVQLRSESSAQRQGLEAQFAERDRHLADTRLQFVSAIERAERNVALLTILRLAEALDVDPGVFLTHDEATVIAAVRQATERREAEARRTSKR